MRINKKKEHPLQKQQTVGSRSTVELGERLQKRTVVGVEGNIGNGGERYLQSTVGAGVTMLYIDCRVHAVLLLLEHGQTMMHCEAMRDAWYLMRDAQKVLWPGQTKVLCRRQERKSRERGRPTRRADAGKRKKTLALALAWSGLGLVWSA